MSFGSFFAALSGLQANASRLSVIGNNLANVNTIGFKSSRVIFHDFFAGSSFNGAGNPAQVGLGTSLASIDAVFNQGSLQTTGLLTDLAVQGQGFYVLEEPGGALAYSRAGNFSFDQDGFLVTSGGHRVQGYGQASPTGSIIASGSLSDVQIPNGLIAAPEPSTNFNLILNLTSNQPTAFSTTMTIFDTLGARHDMVFTFTPSAPVGTWDYDITLPGDEVTGGAPPADFVVASGSLSFDPNGQLISPLANPTLNIPGWTNNAAAQAVTWEMYDANGVSHLTGYNTSSTVASSNQDGHGAGELRSLVIDQDGLISGIFSNGVNLDLARIALATFNNEQGLLRNGENTFLETNSSGTATVGAPNSGGRGATVSGSLELSNVDITEQFTDLIISQRGYQANSRVITTSDEVIQESLNLKR